MSAVSVLDPISLTVSETLPMVSREQLAATTFNEYMLSRLLTDAGRAEGRQKTSKR
jgi:hypothetical protein